VPEQNDTSSGGTNFFARLSVSSYVALMFIVLSLIFYFLIPYQIEKPKLVMGRALMDMKPTLFPRIATVGLCAMSVLYFIKTLRQFEENPFKDLDRGSLVKYVIFLLILTAFAWMFEPIGFVISSIVIVAVLSVFLGNRNIFTLALLSFGVPLTVYFGFTRLLKISLPEGLLY
jgi:putative tricarboxylic transport membrane protein